MASVYENLPASAPLSSEGSLVGMRIQADFTAGPGGWDGDSDEKERTVT